VSVDYYTQMERGNLGGVSDSVLHALAAALQLDEAERAHLFDLAHSTTTTSSRSRRPTGPQRVRPSIQRLLDVMTGVPAYVRTGRLDILAVNRLGHALYAPVLADQPLPVNLARFLFLEPNAGDFYVDWDKTANDAVAILRGEAGRNPYDRWLQDLVGELSTRSPEFRARWAAHNVRLHRTGGKQLHHPVAGDLELTYEALELPADAGLTMITYTAEPGSASQDALDFLASWAATPGQPETAQAPDQA
jgi:MmyB-like transcription regulator ligand binding domain/Helix-turn-helix domain